MMRNLLLLLLIVGFLAPDLKAQTQEMLTVKDSGRLRLTQNRELSVQNLRSMRVYITVNEHATEVSYTASVTANKYGMERHFGDGRLKTTVEEGRSILKYVPIMPQAPREQSWLKALLTKGNPQDAVVESAELRLTIPPNISLEVDSRYSDVELAGLQRNASFYGRYGKLVVKDHAGNLEVDNDFGDVHLSQIGGELHVKSRSNRVYITDAQRDVQITGRSIHLDIQRVKGAVYLENRSGATTVRDVGKELTASLSYGEMSARNIGGRSRVTASHLVSLEASDIPELDLDISQGKAELKNISKSLFGRIERMDISIRDSDARIELDGERINIHLENNTGAHRIRNERGSVTAATLSNALFVSGRENVIQIREFAGADLEIHSTGGGSVEADIRRATAKMDINMVNGPVTIVVPSLFSGWYSIRNDYGTVSHNLEREPFEDPAARMVREISGGVKTDHGGSLRIVNRNGAVSVTKKQ